MRLIKKNIIKEAKYDSKKEVLTITLIDNAELQELKKIARSQGLKIGEFISMAIMAGIEKHSEGQDEINQ